MSFSVRKKIIFADNIKSRSFYFSFDIAGRYAKHREQHYLRYGEQGNNTYNENNIRKEQELKQRGAY